MGAMARMLRAHERRPRFPSLPDAIAWAWQFEHQRCYAACTLRHFTEAVRWAHEGQVQLARIASARANGEIT